MVNRTELGIKAFMDHYGELSVESVAEFFGIDKRIAQDCVHTVVERAVGSELFETVQEGPGETFECPLGVLAPEGA